MNTDKPIWLLDVDGVVNAFPLDNKEKYKVQRVNGFTISYDKTITDRIHDIHLSGRTEVRWLTTWGELANQHIAPLFGWTEFVVSGEPQSGLEWWKFRHAKLAHDNGERIIWTDDDLFHDPESNDWLTEKGKEFGHCGESASRFSDYSAYVEISDKILAIRPNWRFGLTHKDIDRIEEWL